MTLYIKKDGFQKGKIIIVDDVTNTVVNDQTSELPVSKFFNTVNDALEYWSKFPFGSNISFDIRKDFFRTIH